MHRLCSFLVVLAGLASAGFAQAQPPSIDLSSTVETCPDVSWLERAVAERIGTRSVSASRVTVKVERSGSSLVATLQVTGPNGTTSRYLDDPSGDCEALLQAVALSLSLAIGQDATPPIVETPPPEPRKEAIRAPLPVTPPPPHFFLALGVQPTVGLVPQPTTGFSARAGLFAAGNGHLSIRGLYVPEATIPNGSFGLSFASAHLGWCVDHLKTGRFTATSCAEGLLGRLWRRDSQGPTNRDSAWLPGVGLSVGGRGTIAGPWHVAVAIEGIAPLVHPKFLTQTCPAVGFVQPLVALALSFEVGATF